MSYADHLRRRAQQYAEMAARTLCVDTEGATVLGLMAIRLHRAADRMEAA